MPSRRDFLTGRAAQQGLAATGEQVADALAAEGRLPPSAGDTVRLQTRAMACEWAVILNPAPEKKQRDVMTASDALDLVHWLESIMTVYHEDSELSRLNKTEAEQSHAVGEELWNVLALSLELAESTDGAFNPAGGPLIDLWRKCRQAGRIPTSDEVTQILPLADFRRVRMSDEERSVRFEVDGMKLDLGGIGKGYALDRSAAHLRSEGLDDFLIHGGRSSVLACGKHSPEGGWPVGIKNPLFTQRTYGTILLRDQAMATSGSNIQYFRHGGKRYGHILDPRTGRPADSLLSVTVLAPTATQADALSTAFYVMGLENARRYCDNRSDIGAILVPPPEGGSGSRVQPVVCGIPEEQLFLDRD